jgi:site-specific DNA-methyltransferase (adenine-specific)
LRGDDLLIDINKIYNENCLGDKGMRLMPDQSIDLILTDIPYGNVSKNGEERAKYKGQLRNIDKGSADIITFDLEEFLNECYRLCKGSIYIFCGIEQVSKIFSFFDSKKDMTTRQCVWHKTNPSPINGQHYWIHSIENCIYAKKRKTTFNQHCKHNVWEFPVERNRIHPTQKPLKLFEYLIESSSNEGDVVLDPCAGSGTTAIGCINLRRNFIGYEIDKEYYDLAQERINNHLHNAS